MLYMEGKQRDTWREREKGVGGEGEREGGRERNGETMVCCSTHPCALWLNIVCVPFGGKELS